MILGLSHLALVVPDFEAASERLQQYGYRVRFDEPRLVNSPSKRLLLIQYHPEHHIRSFSHPEGLNVELVDHGSCDPEQSATLIPVVAGPSPLTGLEPSRPSAFPFLSDQLLTAAERFCPFVFLFDPILRIHLLHVYRSQHSGIIACVVPSSDPHEVESLLGALRFNRGSVGEWNLTTVSRGSSPILFPVEIRPRPGWNTTPSLDSLGLNCLAFMARTGTINALETDGFTFETFQLTVNRKELIIGMSETRSGIMIELIEEINDY